MKKRALTGIKPTGDFHLGNYLGMVKPALSLQQEYDCFYFIADLHALTTMRDGSQLRDFCYDLAAAWIALGLDTEKHVLFRQSDIPLVAEYSWYLSCVTGMGLLEKGHAYKDAATQGKEVNHGVFSYPVLMAADILLYEPDVVPVGKDQKQHVEMSRNMAGSFNAAFKREVIKLPEPLIEEKVMTIPGLDGRKMSKSYNNYVPVFCEEKALRKKIMSMTTDSTSAEEPKELTGSLVGELFALFASKDQYSDLEVRLAKGGMGWGHAKEELFAVINAELTEPRKKYNELRADENLLKGLLASSTEKASSIAIANLDKLREITGMEKYPYSYKKR